MPKKKEGNFNRTFLSDANNGQLTFDWYNVHTIAQLPFGLHNVWGEIIREKFVNIIHSMIIIIPDKVWVTIIVTHIFYRTLYYLKSIRLFAM